MSGAQAAAEAAKFELAECEKELSSIKATLRLLSPASSVDPETDVNKVSVVALKIEGLPETAKPKLTLQLSSPIEEATLTDIFDPLVEEVPETMKATFRGVQMGQATLTVTALDADIPLGSSESMDLSAVTKFDAMSSKKEYISETSLAIRADGGGDKGEPPVCTITCRVIYEPSIAEKREQLYELLGVATKKKSAVVERLRQASMQAASRQMTPKPAGGGGTPAVKAGFLNKPKAKEPSKWQTWYENYMGPRSFLRRTFPVTKNYFIFFGMVGLFHYKGNLLALPPPV